MFKGDTKKLNAMKHNFSLDSYENTRQKDQEKTAQLLLQDPNIFNYDDDYDQIQQKRKQVELEKIQKQIIEPSKYIQSLKISTLKRQRQQRLADQELAKKKIKRQGGVFNQKQVFVTQSYKKFLEESKDFATFQAKKDEFDLKHTIDGGGQVDNLRRLVYEQHINGYRRIDLSKVKKSQIHYKPREKKIIDFCSQRKIVKK